MKTQCYILSILITYIAASVAGSERKPKEPDPLPDALEQTYISLCKGMKTGDEDKIKTFCLPQAITISHEPRKKHPQYGTDINLPFCKSKFSDKIRIVRMVEKGIYLIGTPTSYFYFVETKHSLWKLYRYGDKPII